MNNLDVCLDCQLDDCDETNPECALWEDKEKPSVRYHRIHKKEPEYRTRRYKHKKKWRKTESGRKSMNESVKKYRKAHPETVKAIQDRYHQKHKEKRNAYSRDYRRRKKEVRDGSLKM